MPTGQVNPNDDDYKDDEVPDSTENEVTKGDEPTDPQEPVLDVDAEDDGIEVVVEPNEEEEGKQHTGFKIVDAGGCPPFNVA